MMKDRPKAKLALVEKVFELMMEASAWISSFILIMMMILITYDVFSRYLFKKPSIWIADFVSLYLIIFVTMLPAAWILVREEHVKVEVLQAMLKPALRRRTTFLTNCFCLIYSIVLTWQGWVFMWRTLTHETAFPTGIYLPMWPAAGVIFLGGLFLSLGSILRIVSRRKY